MGDLSQYNRSSALLPGSRIFVSGGTGFIGAYIIRELVRKGYSISAFKRKSPLPFYIPENILSSVHWIDGDILDVVALQEACASADAVVHAAAVVSFAKQDREWMYKVNVEGTSNVINAAVDAGVKRMLYVSSVAALGRSETGETVTEERKWRDSNINTHYAISKHLAEVEVWRGFAEGLEGCIINPSTVLGFGNWHQSSLTIFRNLYNGFPWYSKGVNGFVGVEDVAKAAVLLLESDINEQRFIVSAENRVFQDLFNTITTFFNKKNPSRQATKFLGSLAWRAEMVKSLFTGKKPLLTKETAKLAHTKTFFDNSSVIKALPGFQFTPLNEVIKRACEQYQEAVEHGQLKP